LPNRAVSKTCFIAAPTAAPGARSRIALINLTYVVKNYEKFKSFQEELKKAVEPFQAKDTSLKAEGDKIAKDAQTPNTTAEKREQIERKLKDIQRAIEDKDFLFKSVKVAAVGVFTVHQISLCC